MIELRTLGRVAVIRDGDELPDITAQKRNLALLIYLGMEGEATRDRLATLFWGEREEEKARHSLSQALYSLRRELGEECLSSAGDLVSAEAPECLVDARQLERAISAEDWEQAVELYSGHFLEGFALFDAPEFERWTSATRAHLMRLARRGFRHVVESREAAGDRAGARALAWRWARLEPLEDEAQHLLITLLARSGDRAAALAQYEAYRSALEEELDVEPLEETRALVDSIRRGEMPAFQPLDGERVEPDSAVGQHEVDQPDPGVGFDEPAEVASAARKGNPLSRLVQRLRRGRLIRVGLVYLGAAWIAVEVCATMIERGKIPPWVFDVLLFFLAVGLPIALIFAWAEGVGGEAFAEAGDGGGPSSGWGRPAHRFHVAAALVSLFLVIVPGYALINWRLPEAHEPLVVGYRYPITRIAVLYFDDHSAGGELDHVAKGLTEELTHQLSKVRTLDVIPRTSVKRFRDIEIPVDSIAALLRVGTVVEGSVAGTSDSVRVTAQLIDTSTLSHLESATADGSLEDPIALIEELGDELARSLRQRLGVEIRLRRDSAATQDPEAWILLQKGRKWMGEAERLHAAGDDAEAARLLDHADSLLVRAQERDSGWPLPAVERAEAAGVRARVRAPRAQSYDLDAVESGLQHVNRALELHPDNADALELKGILLDYLASEADRPGRVDSLRDQAERTLRAAVASDSSSARALSRLSRIYRSEGRFHEAKRAAEAAMRADAFLRHDLVILSRLCTVSLELQEFEQVGRWCGRGRRLYPEDAVFPAIEMSGLLAPQSRLPELEEIWELRRTIIATAMPQERELLQGRTLLQVGAILARVGLPDSALAVMERARAVAQEEDPQIPYWEAYAWLRLGQRDSALDALSEFLNRSPYYHEYLGEDWLWEELHSDPRFQSLLEDGPAPN